jgi:putative peptidoglycan lipid II flippase
MRLIRSIATISLFTMGSRVIGFLRSILMASLVGAGSMADALIIAIKIPSVMRRVFAEGAFNAAFVPLFAGMLARDGHEKARSYAEEIFSILVLILAALILVAELFMPFILKVALMGFYKTPERLEYAITFTRITFPFILFISICALFSGILNSLERFAYAASSPMMGNIAIIATVFALKPFSISSGTAFSWGIAVCGLVQALWVLIPARRYGMTLRLKKPHFSPEVKKFFKTVIPAAAGAGVVQINIFLDMLIASFLPSGGISYLDYAERLNQLPLATIGVAMGTALLPMLSKQLRTGDQATAQKTQNLALEYALWLAVPAALGLMILAHPIVSSVYMHGKLQDFQGQEIGITLMAFATGLPAYIMIKIFTNIYYAHGDTKTPVIVGSIATLLNLSLNIALLSLLAHVGLALATSFASWVNALTLLILLRRKQALVLSARFLKFLPKLGLSSLILAVVLYASRDLIWPHFNTANSQKAIGLSIMILLGLIVYLGTAYALGIIKKDDIRLPRRFTPKDNENNLDENKRADKQHDDKQGNKPL